MVSINIEYTNNGKISKSVASVPKAGLIHVLHWFDIDIN